MELTSELDVVPAKGLSGARVNGLLMSVCLLEQYHPRNNNITGLCDTRCAGSSSSGWHRNPWS